MKLHKILTSCALIAMPSLAFAILGAGIDHEEKHVHPFKEEIEFMGYTYGSYNYLVRSRKFISGDNNRVFDLATNGFRLHQVYLQAELTPKYGVGGFVNVVVGSDAEYIDPEGIDANVFQWQNFGLASPEAYLKFNYGSTMLHAGLMLTLAGAESFVLTENTNYSRSILDGYAQPGKHIGLRLIQWLSKCTKVVFGTVNGWSSVKDAGRQTGFEIGYNYHIGDAFDLTVNYYNTNDNSVPGTSTNPIGRRSLIDIFGHFYVTEKLQLAWNLDYGRFNKAELPTGLFGRAIWKGIDGYINYEFNDRWRTSFRAEVYDDGDGFTTGVRQIWKELTLTLAYKPIKDLELQAETRHDFSSTAAFANQGGRGANNNQQSFGLAALYRFH